MCCSESLHTLMLSSLHQLLNQCWSTLHLQTCTLLSLLEAWKIGHFFAVVICVKFGIFEYIFLSFRINPGITFVVLLFHTFTGGETVVETLLFFHAASADPTTLPTHQINWTLLKWWCANIETRLCIFLCDFFFF